MFYDVEDYLNLPRDPIPWLVQGIIPSNGITNIYGKPKSGKSFLALDLAITLANGDEEWNGFKVLKSGPVAVLQIDTPRGEWAARVANVSHLIDKDKKNLKLADMLTVPYPFNILNPDTHARLKDYLNELNPILTILDTFREAHDLDENDSTAMKKAMSAFITAIGPQRASMMLSHSKKDSAFQQAGGADDLMYDNRGSTYIAGKIDTMIKLSMNDSGTGGMVYKGRGTKHGFLKMFQDPVTGLIHADEEDKMLEHTLKGWMDQLKPEEKRFVSPLAKIFCDRWEKQTGEILSPKTFERRMKKILAKDHKKKGR